MRAFCDCGREHRWKTGEALCPCGQTLEAQTHAEAKGLKEAYGKRIALIIQRNPSIKLHENENLQRLRPNI